VPARFPWPHRPGARSVNRRIGFSPAGQRGSILLEVVLALALFVGAATVIGSGIQASVQAVHRLRLQMHASNLALSILSEIQMRARPAANAGPEACEAPFQDWLYRVVVEQEGSPLDDPNAPSALKPVEIIVWNPQEENAAHRLTQLFRASELAPAGSAEFPEPAP